jgi:hypothetical protein
VPCLQARLEHDGYEGEDSDDDGLNQQPKAKDSYPTMIFCNPNAGYAEFLYYQSEWLDYYVNNGINMFVWNYRGFGLSEGNPTPKV